MRKLLLLFVFALFLAVGCSDDEATVTEVDDAGIAVTVDETGEGDMNYPIDDEDDATAPEEKRESTDDDGDGFDDVESDSEDVVDEDDVDSASGDDLC